MKSVSFDLWGKRALVTVDIEETTKLCFLCPNILRRNELHQVLSQRYLEINNVEAFTTYDLMSYFSSRLKPPATLINQSNALVFLKYIYEINKGKFPNLELYRSQISKRQAGHFFIELSQQLKEACVFASNIEDLFAPNEEDSSDEIARKSPSQSPINSS